MSLRRRNYIGLFLSTFRPRELETLNIITETLRQNFHEPDPEAAKFWLKHFSTMLAEAKKYH